MVTNSKLYGLGVEELQKVLKYPKLEQALVMSAYLDEEQRWVKKLDMLYKQMNDIMKQIDNQARVIEEQENSFLNNSGFFKNVNSKVKGAEGKIKELEVEYSYLVKKYTELKNSPPPFFRYELAILGNNIFDLSKVMNV